MSVAVAADIESICSKCGDVWHVVVAKVGEKIAKVQCKECGGVHRYRPPGGSKSRAKSTSTRRRSSSTKKTASTQPVARIDTPMVEPDMSKPSRPYRFTDTFIPGERIEHPKFGLGVVEITSEPGKMQVFFPGGRRVLALAKPKSTLERPKPFRHDSREPS